MPSEVIPLLQSLIQIPSVNPDSAKNQRDNILGEKKMAGHVADYLKAIGYTVTLEEVQPHRPNVIARAPYEKNSLDPRPRILLGPHLDTVTVEGMTIEPFSGEIRDGKIWGRGASDTKGPMAAMLQALSNCQDILAKLPVAVDFIGFMGEEAYQHGSKDFAEKYATDYKFALVGEPTSLQIVHTTKGSLWATIRAEGKAAHASQPELGENAILKLTRALHLLDSDFSKELATYTHHILGKTSLNIGTINGGSIPNIVPEKASAQLDIRTTPSIFEQGGALSLLEAFIAQHQLPLTISASDENPPMDIPVDCPWIKQMQTANSESKLVGAPWFSDAAHLSHQGLHAICIGPGSIEQAHTKDEFISIEDLESGVTYFEQFIRSLSSVRL